MSAAYVCLHVERALYADFGREVILCDRLPAPAVLVVKVTREELRRALDEWLPELAREQHD